MCLCKIRFWMNCWLYGLYFDDVRIQVLWLLAPCVLNIYIYIKNKITIVLGLESRVVTGSIFVEDFWGRRGCLRCRIQASPVEAVSLMISEAPWTVCAVQSTRHPWKQFRWWFLRPHGLFALSNPRVTRGSSFVDDFWRHMGCLRCRIHVSPWKQFRWWFSSRKWLGFVDDF
jgi:hypothetical protein